MDPQQNNNLYHNNGDVHHSSQIILNLSIISSFLTKAMFCGAIMSEAERQN